MKKSSFYLVLFFLLIPVFVLAQGDYNFNLETGVTESNNTGNNPASSNNTGSNPGSSNNTGATVPLVPAGSNNTGSNPPGSSNTGSSGGGQQPSTSAGGGQAPTTGSQPQTNIAKLENPLGSRVNSLTGLFIKLVNIVVNISYAVVAFFLILSGFKFVVAQGKPQEIESAKKTFWYTIVGGLIIVGAQTIARILEELVKNL